MRKAAQWRILVATILVFVTAGAGSVLNFFANTRSEKIQDPPRRSFPILELSVEPVKGVVLHRLVEKMRNVIEARLQFVAGLARFPDGPHFRVGLVDRRKREQFVLLT